MSTVFWSDTRVWRTCQPLDEAFLYPLGRNTYEEVFRKVSEQLVADKDLDYDSIPGVKRVLIAEESGKQVAMASFEVVRGTVNLTVHSEDSWEPGGCLEEVLIHLQDLGVTADIEVTFNGETETMPPRGWTYPPRAIAYPPRPAPVFE